MYSPSVLALGGIALWIQLAVLPLGHSAALKGLSLAVVLLAALLAWRQLPPPRHPGPMAALFLGWFGLAAVSALWSVNPAYTLEAALTDVPRAALLYWAAYSLARRGLDWRAAAWAGSVFLLLAAPLAARAPRDATGVWEAGWLPATGDYATDALMFLPFVALAFGSTRGAWARCVFGLALLAGLYGGYLCISRSFWLTLGVMIFCGVGAWGWHSGAWRRHGRPLALATLVLALLVAGLASLSVRQREISLFHLADRARIYPAVVEKLRQGPLLGIGYGKETDAVWYENTFPEFIGVRHPHNIVLSFTDQLGVLGLPLLAALFGIPARQLWLGGREGGAGARRLSAVGLALLAGVAVKNGTDLFFYKQHLWLLYGLLGLCLGALARMSGGRTISAS